MNTCELFFYRYVVGAHSIGYQATTWYRSNTNTRGLVTSFIFCHFVAYHTCVAELVCCWVLCGLLSYPDLKSQYVLSAHPANCICIEFDPTGMYFATGSADALVSLWDLSELVCLRTLARYGYQQQFQSVMLTLFDDVYSTSSISRSVLWQLFRFKYRHIFLVSQKYYCCGGLLLIVL